MPKKPPAEIIEIENKLYSKIESSPLEFTLDDYITLLACIQETLSAIDEIKSDMGNLSETLPDGYESIVLPRESDIMYLLFDDLELFSDRDQSRFQLQQPYLYQVSECIWENIRFHILHFYGEESWIFSKSNIDKLKSILSKYPECDKYLRND